MVWILGLGFRVSGPGFRGNCWASGSRCAGDVSTMLYKGNANLERSPVRSLRSPNVGVLTNALEVSTKMAPARKAKHPAKATGLKPPGWLTDKDLKLLPIML